MSETTSSKGEIHLPRFMSQPSRWDRDLQAKSLEETMARGRRLRRNTILRTIVLTALATFVACAFLNGIDAMPSVQIQVWTH